MFIPITDLQEKLPMKTGYQIPTLMPDEYWIGYLGRLLIVNGINHKDCVGNIIKFLKNLIKENYSEFLNHSTFTKIAIISETKNETLLQRHSLIPFLRVSNSKIYKLSSKKGVYRILSGRFIKKGTYFCKSCVNEDINYRGISYWRRSHQLPGIDWCLKHDCNLCVVIKKNAMLTSPEIYLWDESYSECFIPEEVRQDPIVQKFSDTVQHVADNNILFNSSNIAQILSKKAAELNLNHKNNKDNGKFISDFLVEKIPASWINQHFPNLSQSTRGQFLYEFDDVLRAKNDVRVVNLLLIISALLQSSNNVLGELSQYSHTKRLTRSIFLKEIISKKIITEEIISKAYIKYFGQTKNIAKEINYSDQITAKLLIYFGYYPLAPITQTTIKALMEFKQGVPIEKLLCIKDVNIHHIFLITHPSIKGMREILNSIKNDDTVNDSTTLMPSTRE